MTQPISIIKMSGEREAWDPRKLKRSLYDAKAPEDLVNEITLHMEKDLRDGMRTSDIYQHAFELLKRYDRPVAGEYSLKRALTQFGPSGFPFERFVARLLQAEGYHTKVGVITSGACVQHEVDVVAEKDDERIIVEAKFHNTPHTKSDVKVALYVHARFQDIAKRLESNEGEQRFNRAWLITNTNFTSQAIQYGNCAGLAMTGWNYPKDHTLQDLIQATQSHPLTCLTTLSDTQKNQLLGNGIVLCRDVIDDTSHLEKLGINKARIDAVVEEGTQLCPVR